jgi:predicted  nucleic acid-binding Zn-ribbon protein
MEFEMDKYLGSEQRDLASTDQVDSAGQAIVTLLHNAADAGEAKIRQTVEAAQGLSKRLDAARERITALESDLQSFREKADRAEQWLGKISMEIEDRLIAQGRRGVGN